MLTSKDRYTHAMHVPRFLVLECCLGVVTLNVLTEEDSHEHAVRVTHAVQVKLPIAFQCVSLT